MVAKRIGQLGTPTAAVTWGEVVERVIDTGVEVVTTRTPLSSEADDLWRMATQRDRSVPS